MIKLYEYFGVVGLASILAWLAALVLLARAALERRRPLPRCAAAIAVAILAVGLAKINSHAVSTIQTDRSEEIEAARRAAMEQQAAVATNSPEMAQARSPRQFAEDEGSDEATRAGVKEEKAPTNAPALLDESLPEYRKGGKVERASGRKQSVGDMTAAEVVGPPEKVRAMKEPDVLAANRLDRLNLLVVHLLLLGSLGLTGWKYVSRFNTTLDAIYPLPLAGRVLDALFPKTLMALIVTRDPQAAPNYAETCVRKGEPFLFFGPADPWPQAEALPRLALAGRTILRRRKIVCGDSALPSDPEFTFDAAWFDRYAVVIPGEALGWKMLDSLMDLQRSRTVTRAATARTVNVVWTCDRLPSAAQFHELRYLFSVTNFKFVAFARQAPAEAAQQPFDEVLRLD